MGYRRFRVAGCKYILDADVPGSQFTIIEGGNKGGKTLFGKLFLRTFLSTHDPDLIRDGCDRMVSEVELGADVIVTVFDKKTGKPQQLDLSGALIQRMITATTSTSKITLPNGNVVKDTPETILKKILGAELGDEFASDPFSFIDADPKKREAFLRRVLPMEFMASEIDKELGICSLLPEIVSLSDFDQYLAGREGARSDANKNRDNLEGAVNAMREMPSLDGKDWSGLATGLQTALSDAEQAERADLSDVAREYNQKTNDRKARLEREIEDLRKAAQADVNIYAQEYVAEVETVHKNHKPIIDKIREDLAIARNSADAQNAAKGALAKMEELRGQLRDAARKATELQEHVEKLRELRRKKLENLPVQGIEWRGQKLYVDGKEFDTELNTEAQCWACIRLGSLAAGPLAVMFTDRIESFDPENKWKLLSAVAATDFHLMMTRVTAGPLKITATDDPREALTILTKLPGDSTSDVMPGEELVSTAEPAR